MPIFVGTGNSTFLSASNTGKGIGVGVGTTNTTGRNAGVGTAPGTLIFNSDTGGVQVFGSNNTWSNVGASSPTSLTDYPLPTGSYQVFSTDWPGSPANLPVSDSPTTFTVPAAAGQYIRVVVVGGASASPPNSANAGAGAYIDALIPVSPGIRFKAIVGGGGGTASCIPGSCNSPDTRGGNGCGGGCGVDSNDAGSGGGGSAFFYAEPGATSDPAMFPLGVLIAGGGGGGTIGATPAGAGPGPSPEPIGGFNGIFRAGTSPTGFGEPGQAGGTGGRVRNNSGTLVGSNAARGSGGAQQNEGYGGCNGGTGGGAGAGGYGGDCNPGASPKNAENAPDGRGRGYDALNDSGSGLGGAYPMKGGNGMSFQGVNLGGGAGGSHGAAHAGGGWGGGGGVYYDRSGGSGGSGAWGYYPGTATIQGWTPSASITVRGGSVNSIMSVPTSLGTGSGNPGYIVVMW